MKLSAKMLIAGALLAFPSYSLAYEASQEEIAFVCQGEQQCINIVSDELSDITIDGNLRIITPDAFRSNLADYCEVKTVECETYVKMMVNTFDSAYLEGDK